MAMPWSLENEKDASPHLPPLHQVYDNFSSTKHPRMYKSCSMWMMLPSMGPWALPCSHRMSMAGYALGSRMEEAENYCIVTSQ